MEYRERFEEWELRKAEARAKILALQDRPKIEAEIERWVSGHIHEYPSAQYILGKIDDYIGNIAEMGIEETTIWMSTWW